MREDIAMYYSSPDDKNQRNGAALLPETPLLQMIPDGLKRYSDYVQWVAWGYDADSTPTAICKPGTFDDIFEMCEELSYGLGFLLTEEDKLTVVHLPNCIHSDSRMISQTALTIIRTLQTYGEYDDTRDGIHLILEAKLGANAKGDGIRVWDHGYLLPVTGNRYSDGIEIREKEAQLASMVANFCVVTWLGRVDELRGSGTEEEVLSRVLADCLETIDSFEDPDDKTGLYPFLAKCWEYGRLRLTVRTRAKNAYMNKDMVNDLIEVIKSYMPKKEKAPKVVSGDEPESDPGSLEAMLHYDAKGTKVQEDFYNVSMILQHHEKWDGRLKFDTFQNNVILDNVYPLSDSIEYEITEWFGREYAFGGNSGKTFLRGIHAASLKKKQDPLLEYIQSLPAWDQIPRLQTWMIEMCGSPDNRLSRWISYMTIMQMIARAMKPGCMARNVPVWEGAENTGKTRMIKLLGSPWSITFDMSMDNKEAHMAIQGVWVAELAELDTLRKTTETRLKSFVSQTQDTYVPKYSNNRVSVNRRTVFFGTTNDDDYLPGLTGNTRWFPIVTGDFDYKRLEREREQLFAEAMSIFNENPDVTWWVEPDDIKIMLKEARDQRRSFNPYEEALHDWLNSAIYCPAQTSWQDIAQNFLKLETKKEWKDKVLQRDITNALKALGWKKKYDGKSTVWLRPKHEGAKLDEGVPF